MLWADALKEKALTLVVEGCDALKEKAHRPELSLIGSASFEAEPFLDQHGHHLHPHLHALAMWLTTVVSIALVCQRLTTAADVSELCSLMLY